MKSIFKEINKKTVRLVKAFSVLSAYLLIALYGTGAARADTTADNKRLAHQLQTLTDDFRAKESARKYGPHAISLYVKVPAIGFSGGAAAGNTGILGD